MTIDFSEKIATPTSK